MIESLSDFEKIKIFVQFEDIDEGHIQLILSSLPKSLEFNTSKTESTTKSERNINIKYFTNQNNSINIENSSYTDGDSFCESFHYVF